jgi:hygromycin-B 4-O-kinase
MESQAFRFAIGKEWFVIRIGRSLRGFEKDRWAATTVGKRVPVPDVVAIGTLESRLAYCVTDWAPGQTLEDLPPANVGGLAGAVATAWQRLSETDVTSIDGFGDFNPAGSAPEASWRDVLTRTRNEVGRDLGLAAPQYLRELSPVIAAYEQLIDDCPPAARALVHGDFGDGNVIADGQRITAVLDWDCAMVGDPLYDVANTYFWATHLDCMRVQAEYFDRTLSGLPAYSERIRCYALRIGFVEVVEDVRDNDARATDWLVARCRELLRELL